MDSTAGEAARKESLSYGWIGKAEEKFIQGHAGKNVDSLIAAQTTGVHFGTRGTPPEIPGNGGYALVCPLRMRQGWPDADGPVRPRADSG